MFRKYRNEADATVGEGRKRWLAAGEGRDLRMLGAYRFDGGNPDRRCKSAYLDPQVDEYTLSMEDRTKYIDNMRARRVDLYVGDRRTPTSKPRSLL